MNTTDQLNTFRTSLDTVLATPGAVTPPEIPTILAGVDHLNGLRLAWPEEAARMLNEAVVAGDTEHIASAAAELQAARTWHRGADAEDAHRAALTALRVAYTSVAAANYAAARDALKAAVSTLNADVAAVDVEAAPEAVIQSSAKARTAWEFAPAHARDVETAVATLHLAASLAGANLAHVSHERQDDQVLTLLTLEHPEAGDPMRELWRTFDSEPGRTGRLGALARAGLLTGPPALEALTALRRARGWSAEYEHSGIGHRPVKVDEETGRRYHADGTEVTPLEQLADVRL